MIHEFIAALKLLRCAAQERAEELGRSSHHRLRLGYHSGAEEKASMHRIFAPEAMLAEGWDKDVVIDVDDQGNIAAVRARQGPGGAETAGGPVIPGMANVHSHAFQRAMAGLAERMGSPEDSFWTWREVMYSFLKQLGPDQVRAIASQLYCEMLKNGYTAVAEFHYLHNAP
jgi:formimidoylglutamate deiminase